VNKQTTSITSCYPQILIKVEKIKIAALGTKRKGELWELAVLEASTDDVTHDPSQDNGTINIFREVIPYRCVLMQ